MPNAIHSFLSTLNRHPVCRLSARGAQVFALAFVLTGIPGLAQGQEQCETLFFSVRDASVDRALSPSSTASRQATKVPFIAESPAMKETIEAIAKFARVNTPIYLEEESGSGKEVLAQHVHQLSGRPGEFVAVNVGAIPETLLAAELFGVKRGAFTGAAADRDGFVTRAEKGTLFLDEIADLSPTAQVLLLRFLDTKTYNVVGSEGKLLRADVRFVFATHKNLEALVKQGVFRQDLYFRISGVHIDVPSLRERPEDILPMARYYLEQSAREFAVAAPSLSNKARAFLMTYSFPGNVRELASMMKIAVAATPAGAQVQPESFFYGRRRKSTLEFPTLDGFTETVPDSAPKAPADQRPIEPAAVSRTAPIGTKPSTDIPSLNIDELKRIAFLHSYLKARDRAGNAEPTWKDIGDGMKIHGESAKLISEDPILQNWLRQIRLHHRQNQSTSDLYMPDLNEAINAQLPTLDPRRLLSYAILHSLNKPDSTLRNRRSPLDAGFKLSIRSWAELVNVRPQTLESTVAKTPGWNYQELVAERERNGSVDVEAWMSKIPQPATP